MSRVKKTPSVTTLKELFEGVCVGAVRFHFDGVVRTCAACTLSVDELVESWKASVPTFAPCIEDHIRGRPDKYPSKWTTKGMMEAMTNEDKNAIRHLFGVDLFDPVFESMAEHPNRNKALMTLAIFLCAKARALPTSRDADKHGLWPAFKEYYPTSAASLDEACPPARGRKRSAPDGESRRSKAARTDELSERLERIDTLMMRIAAKVGVEVE